MRMFRVLIISICVLFLNGDMFEGRNGMTCGSWVLAKECSYANFPWFLMIYCCSVGTMECSLLSCSLSLWERGNVLLIFFLLRDRLAPLPGKRMGKSTLISAICGEFWKWTVFLNIIPPKRKAARPSQWFQCAFSHVTEKQGPGWRTGESHSEAGVWP